MTEIEQIQEMLGVDSAEKAVKAVAELRAMLNSITVVPVVMVGNQPLFVQMPPDKGQSGYDPAVLEIVRDALIDASASMRPAIFTARRLLERLTKESTEASDE